MLHVSVTPPTLYDARFAQYPGGHKHGAAAFSRES